MVILKTAMRIRFVPYVVVLLLTFSLTAESSQGIVTVHYPADLAIMEFDLLSISLSFPEGSADFIEVEVNSHIKASVVPHRNFACLSVPLEIGPNEI